MKASTSLRSVLLLLAPTVFGRAAPRPVDHFDLGRFVGRWHEIARLPTTFERDCRTNITTDHFVDGPNRLGIRHACIKVDGSLNAAYGVAQQRDSSRPGQLKATFTCSAFQWLPTLWAEYFILLLDDNYAWATIGDPQRTHFWIIAREPTLPKLIFDMLRHHAEVLGYDIDRLIISGRIV